MTINDRAIKLRCDAVELITKMSHLFGAVLIACNDFVNRVDDNRRVLLFNGSPDEFWSQLIHRQRFSPKIPYIDIRKAAGFPAKFCVHVFKSMQARGGVKLQIHIQDSSLGAIPIQPFAAFGNGDNKFYKGKGLTRLRRSCQ